MCITVNSPSLKELDSANMLDIFGPVLAPEPLLEAHMITQSFSIASLNGGKTQSILFLVSYITLTKGDRIGKLGRWFVTCKHKQK